jgi:hypothetical protein
MILSHLLPYIERVTIAIVAVAIALVLSVLRLFGEFGAFSPGAILFVAVGLIIYAMWRATVGVKDKLKRRRSPKPITHQQFVDLFRLLDDKLYSGLLRRNGIGVFVTDIRPDYPFIYRCRTTTDGKLVEAETCSEPHGYSPACREIVVAQNQSNEAIMKGLLIEMQRAADHQRELHKPVASELERGAEVLEELDSLLKRSDHDAPERQMEEVVKLLGRWPKAPIA